MDLKHAIETRHTLKVLADPELPWDMPDYAVREVVDQLLSVAINAPFHKPAHKSHCGDPLSSPVPWRFHAFDTKSCRNLAERIGATDLQSGKIPNMLAAADALIMATWLPNPSEQFLSFQEFEPTLQNMEHIAASSAAIQNLLLLATEAELNNYWSSGGILRSKTLFTWMSIPLDQILLGAIFLFPQETRGVDVKPGGLRDRKGNSEQWSRWVEI